jgi:hypothetical protein
MGWMKVNDNEIGDEVVDRLHEAMEAILNCYQEDLGRNPTKAEIEVSIAAALDSSNREFEFLTGFTISGVKIATKKSSKSTKLKEGDVFRGCIEGNWFYGRVVLKEQIGTLVEFYDIPGDRVLSSVQVLNATWPAAAHRYVFDRSITHGETWQIMGNVPIEDNYKYPVTFTLGGNVYRGHEKIMRNQKKLIKTGELTSTYGVQPFVENLKKYGLDTWPDTKEGRKTAIAAYG